MLKPSTKQPTKRVPGRPLSGKKLPDRGTRNPTKPKTRPDVPPPAPGSPVVVPVAPSPLSIKVFKLGSDNGSSSVAIIPPFCNTEAELMAMKLEQLRPHMVESISFQFGFCLEDGAQARETMTMLQYLEAIGPEKGQEQAEQKQEEPQQSQGGNQSGDAQDEDQSQEGGNTSRDVKVKNSDSDKKQSPALKQGVPQTRPSYRIYIKELSKTVTGIFDSVNFMLKFIFKDEESTSEESLMSSAFSKEEWQNVTLAHLRKRIKNMSQFRSSKVFCYGDGTAVPDTMKLRDYLAKGGPPKDASSDLPTFSISFRRSGPKKEPPTTGTSALGDEDAGEKFLKFDLAKGKGVTIGDMKRARADVAKLGLQDADIRALAAGPIVQFLHAGELDEQEWETVLRNSSVMHGWYVDMQTKRIKQAPKPAFRLRPGLNMPAELTALPPLLGEKMRRAKPLLPGVDPQSTGYSDPTAATGEEEPQESGETPGAPGEGQEEEQDEEEDKETQPTSDSGVSTNMMMNNASLLILERDSDHQTVDDDDENSDQSLESVPESGSEPAPEPVSASHPAPTSASASETAPAPVGASPLLRDNKPERLPSFPSFTVNDNSKIEVTVAHHEIHVSMAKNNFSMTGFEAAASGSFFGISASASGGFTEEKATGSGSTSDKKERTMIARYNFPRATLYLRPEDLEITPELRDAIAKVHATKDLSELRKLHEMFGHLFCHEVILGGSLQTTRTTTSSDQQTWTTEKEKFKAEVGASIGYGGFSASTKYKTGKESEEERKQQETQVNDKMLFEATGGNTILAANPPLWSSSVLHHNNWRVIERTEMKSLADAIATCHTPGLEKVREWFVNAVPIRSQFIEIPPSRTMMVRLKTIAPIPGKEENTLNTNRYYFGYNKTPVHYQRMGVQRRERVVTQDVVKYGGGLLVFADLTTSLVQRNSQTSASLFHPSHVRAPTLLQYEDSYKEDKFSTLDNYQETVWTMTVMDGEYLQDGSLISLKSYSKDSELYLTVFRNEQGHYLPAITDAGAAPYWRVQKMQGSSRQDGQLIRDSDHIRLCWSFADQRGGFRDYMDDVFGRRRFHVPEDEPENLYMKVPFPGFQRSDAADGIAMIMHTEEATKSYATTLNVLPHKEFDNMGIATYCLYDLTFRLDVLDTPGQQELNDFMIYGLKQPSEVVLKDEKRIAQVRSRHFTWGGDSDVTRTAKAVSYQMGMVWQAMGHEVANYKLGALF